MESGLERAREEAYIVTLVRGDDGNSDDYSEDRMKKVDSRYVLVVELPGFAERSDVGNDYRSIHDSFQVSGLRT